MFPTALRRRVTGLGVTAGLVLALVAPAPVAAEPRPGSPAPLPGPGSSTEVRLLTGDVLSVDRLADGRYVATPLPGQHRTGHGGPVSYRTLRTPQGDLYVIPSDASAALTSGVLDLDLFNVTELVESGYTADRPLPVIVRYAEGTAPGARAAARADSLPGVTAPRPLESIDAAGVSLPAGERAAFWSTLRAEPTARGLRPGIERVWLDRKVRVSLDRSVPQIGAPRAWDAGLDGTGVSVAVLDTGVDAGHPDLADRIAGTRGFVPGLTTVDGHGHGTHVAATIAGSGAASGGRYKGVASGARLLVGKVLDDEGNGNESWVIDGMEWAASSGARAVNMSLGGGATDGTDPMSLAVDELTARTGTLFVIAAGNDGPGARTVASPGTAASALTVGAVDRDDRLAGFSARGPLTRSFALKPDLTAPGVGIVAARASGTSLGSPVDEHHTALSGTSMATPHVAGSVAILAQQHPGWRAGQLKALLTGTATPTDGLTGYEQGTGRVDVAAAITGDLTAEPSAVDFGRLVPPHRDPVTKTVTLTNHGDTPATVDLEAGLLDPSGAAADELIDVRPATVTVPAGGSANVEVTFDPTRRADGVYSGVVRAVDPAGSTEVLRLAVGAYQAPPGHNLRLVAKPPAGWPNGRMLDFASWTLLRTDAPQDPIYLNRGSDELPTRDVWVPDGVYSVSVSFRHVDPVTGDFTLTELLDPEVVVRGQDAEVVLDGTATVPVTVDTPRPSQLNGVWQTLVRGTAYGGAYEQSWQVSSIGPYGRMGLRVTPTEPVTVGSARFVTGIEAVEATAGLRLHGRHAPTLDVSWPQAYFQAPKLDLRNRPVTIVDVGAGTAAEIDRARVAGTVVLVTRPWREADQFNHPASPAQEVMARLADAGALAMLLAVDEGPARWCGPGLIDGGMRCAATTPLPVLRIGPGEADRLRAFADGAPVRAGLSARTQPGYSYRLRFEEPTVSDGVYRPRADRLRTVRASYRTEQPRDYRRSTLIIDAAGTVVSTGAWVPGPSTRTEYVGPVSDRVLWWERASGIPRGNRDAENPLAGSTSEETVVVYDSRRPSTAEWGLPAGIGAVRPPAAVTGSPAAAAYPTYDGCLFCRDGDGLWVLPSQTYGGGDRHGDNYFWMALLQPERVEAHLYRDGTEVPTGAPVFWDLSRHPEPADYRLTYRVRPTGPGASVIDTTWEFRSQRPTGDQATRGFECNGQGGPDAPPPPRLCRAERMPHVGWDISPTVRTDNTAAAPGRGEVRLSVYRQEGAPDPRVAYVRVQVSYDGGTTWRRAEVRRAGGDEYRVRLRYPPVRPDGGSVSLRAQVGDTEGNRVEQTLVDFYRLTPRR